MLRSRFGRSGEFPPLPPLAAAGAVDGIPPKPALDVLRPVSSLKRPGSTSASSWAQRSRSV